jgi:hypothetical protein
VPIHVEAAADILEHKQDAFDANCAWRRSTTQPDATVGDAVDIHIDKEIREVKRQ